MPVARKPLKKNTEKQVEEFIGKGGSSPQKEVDERREHRVLVGIPLDVLVRIDTARKVRTIRTPRIAWLLEAALEKLKREGF